MLITISGERRPYFTFKKSLVFIGEFVYKICEFVSDKKNPLKFYDINGENEQIVHPCGLIETRWLDTNNEFETQEAAVRYLQEADEIAAEYASEYVILPVWLAPIQF